MNHPGASTLAVSPRVCGKKEDLFDGGILGPALLEWPGHAKTGRAIDVPCSTLDYLPTLADMLGYKMPDDRPIDGASLMPLINEKTNKRQKPIPFWFIRPTKKAMHGSPTLALIDNNYKFLTNLSEDGHEDMLYDVVKNTAEQNNIITKHTKIAAYMRAYLKKWTESCKKSHSGADYPTPFTPVDQFPIITGTWRK